MDHFRLPTPSEIAGYLDGFIHGQGIAKRDLAICVYNHYLAQARAAVGLREGVADLGRNHLLILGPTGSGKTYMVTQLAKFLGVPISLNSATSLVSTGYVGQHVESLVTSLLEGADNDPRRAERGIVYIDEIDKIRSNYDSGGPDVGGEGVQHSLLTMLEGRTIRGVDTSKLLFVCTGAFVELPDIVRRRMNKGRSVIGFRSPEDVPRDLDASDRSIYEALCNVSPEDLKDYGFIPEFTGRFARLTPVAELSKGNLIAILKGSKGSVLEQKRAGFRLHGIDLVFDDDALEAIADQAAALKTGARALNRILMDVLQETEWALPTLVATGVSKVRIDLETVQSRKRGKVIGHHPINVALLIQEWLKCLRTIAHPGKGGGGLPKWSGKQKRKAIKRLSKSVAILRSGLEEVEADCEAGKITRESADGIAEDLLPIVVDGLSDASRVGALCNVTEGFFDNDWATMPLFIAYVRGCAKGTLRVNALRDRLALHRRRLSPDFIEKGIRDRLLRSLRRRAGISEDRPGDRREDPTALSRGSGKRDLSDIIEDLDFDVDDDLFSGLEDQF